VRDPTGPGRGKEDGEQIMQASSRKRGRDLKGMVSERHGFSWSVAGWDAPLLYGGKHFVSKFLAEVTFFKGLRAPES
jgi:hypothetical protein